MPVLEETHKERRLGVAEAKAHLSDVISSVEQTGEPYVVMRYGRPVAMIVPVPRASRDAGRARGLLADFASDGLRALEEGAFERAMVVKHGDPA